MRLPKRWTTWRPRIYGADIRIHVSAWLLIGIIALSTLKTPLVALAAICAYLGLVLLHEFGHAYFAHRLGYAVHEIERRRSGGASPENGIFPEQHQKELKNEGNS